MARKVRTPLPKTDPEMVEKVLAKYRSNHHVMSPRPGSSAKAGCSCFVWVSGVCYSENCLVLEGGHVEKELRALPHAYDVHINID